MFPLKNLVRKELTGFMSVFEKADLFFLCLIFSGIGVNGTILYLNHCKKQSCRPIRTILSKRQSTCSHFNLKI